MNQTRNRWLVALLVLALALPLYAAAEPDKGFEKPLSLSVNVIYTNLVEADARTRFVLDKFNLDIQFIACSTNDIAEKTRLWIAGGDMPDVMWSAYNVGAAELIEFAQSGQLRAFPDLAAYPNLKAIQDALGQSVEKNNQLCGGSYYYLVDTGYAEYNLLNATGWYYRRDWAEKVGLLNEDDVYTWDEMVALAKAFVEQDPGGNGPGNTIGITSIGGHFPGYYGIDQMAQNWSGYKKVDGSYVWMPMQPETLEGLKLAQQLYADGLLWDEQIMAQANDGPNKFFAGLAGICSNNWHIGQVTTLVQSVRDAFPDLDIASAYSPMKLLSPDGTMLTTRIPGYWGQWSLSAALGEEQMARFLQMMDYLASPEGQRLGAIGIPGVDYTMDGETITLLWEKDDKGNAVSPYQANAHRFITFPSLAEGYGLVNPASNPIAREMAKRHMDMVQTEEGRTVAEIDLDLTLLQTPLYRSTMLSPSPVEKAKELIMTSKDIEADWNAYVQSMWPQVEPVLAEINQALCP